MKVKFIYAASVLLLVLGCKPIEVEYPTVNVPPELRERNWAKGGSCTWAAMVTLLRWQGQGEVADWIRQYKRGGEIPETLAEELDAIGIRYAYCIGADPSFLEWAIGTRRGCGIDINRGRHMVVLVYLDSNWAAVWDSNQVEVITWLPRERLLADWQASRGWAVTPVYSPAAPLPQ